MGDRGLTLVEILIAVTISGGWRPWARSGCSTSGAYNTVGGGGRSTMALTAAAGRCLRMVRLVPFANLPNLNGPAGTGFDTNTAGTLPAANVERAIARKWRYALAVKGPGGSSPHWRKTGMEQTVEWGRWRGQRCGSRVITVADFGGLPGVAPRTRWHPGDVRQVTVTVRVPAGGMPVTLSTRISRP